MLLRHILMLDDTPHSIALGTTIGIFIGMTPTVGIQMILVIVFAVSVRRLFMFNRVAALITVYISNPLTVVPIYYFDYYIGSFFVKGDATWQAFVDNLGADSSLGLWDKLVWLFAEVGTPLIVGSLIAATTLSIVTYPLMRIVLRGFRRQHIEPVEIEHERAATTSD